MNIAQETKEEPILNLLENFFSTVETGNDIKKILDTYQLIIDNSFCNEQLKYMCFWICFVNSNEIFCEEILQKNVIYFKGNIQLKLLSGVGIAARDLNNYAFEIACESNFNENMLLIILNKGKIDIPIEFLYEKLKANKLDFIELIWKAGNLCFFKTVDLKQEIVEHFKQEIEFYISDEEIKTALFEVLNIKRPNYSATKEENNQNEDSKLTTNRLRVSDNNYNNDSYFFADKKNQSFMSSFRSVDRIINYSKIGKKILF